MKTTLVIPDPVMKRVKEHAARQGTTISEIVEAALRSFFAAEEVLKKSPPPPLPSFHGGEYLVDITDRDALYRAMEED